MDIASLSMGLSSYKAESGASISMLKKAKEQMEQTGDIISQMIEATPTSGSVQINDGQSLDIRI